MRWAGHVVRMGESIGVSEVLVGKPVGVKPLERPRRRWEDILKRSSGSGMCGLGLDRSGSE